MKLDKRLPWQVPLFVRVSIALHVLILLMVVIKPAIWPWALAIVIANHALISMIGLWPRSQWLGQNWTHLPDAAVARNEIALTIDDGPDPVVTPQVLDILQHYQVKATFFCIGNKAARYPDLCREIVSRGHAVENHSQQHRHNFSLLGQAGFVQEIQAAQHAITEITGSPPQFFRAPAGLRNPFLDPALHRLGLRLASWTVRGFDTRTNNVEKVKARLLRGLYAGSILLLHDGNSARTSAQVPVIIEVLPALLESAAAQNLRFVTLREAAA